MPRSTHQTSPYPLAIVRDAAGDHHAVREDELRTAATRDLLTFDADTGATRRRDDKAAVWIARAAIVAHVSTIDRPRPKEEATAQGVQYVFPGAERRAPAAGRHQFTLF